MNKEFTTTYRGYGIQVEIVPVLLSKQIIAAYSAHVAILDANGKCVFEARLPNRIGMEPGKAADHVFSSAESARAAALEEAKAEIDRRVSHLKQASNP